MPGLRQQVDLEEEMDPLAVAESGLDRTWSLATALLQAAVIGIAAVAIWWLLPVGVTARPPLELPAALQAEVPGPSHQREAENKAVALLKQAVPSQALKAFRARVESPEGASVGLWRYYLQTLVDLDERRELRGRAADFFGLFPDRLEAAHFLCEAIRRDDPDAYRDHSGAWNVIRGAFATPPVKASYIAEIDRCQGAITDALALLQRHESDWPSSGRTAWADLLHLDRARLHEHAWRCAGYEFHDPHREQALEAIRQLSSDTTADAVSLRLQIYGTCRAAWPRRLGFASKRELVNGRDWSPADLERAIDRDRTAVDALPPLGRR